MTARKAARGGLTPRAERHGSAAVLLATVLKPPRDAPTISIADLPPWLRRLEAMDVYELQEEWAVRFSVPAPDIRSRDVLRHVIAWRVQAHLSGGHDAETLRRLRGLMADQTKGKPLAPNPRLRLTPGTVLSREWKGRTHRVTVESVGFSYEGKFYASLSEIARLITGTRWSGPRLFGLEADLR